LCLGNGRVSELLAAECTPQGVDNAVEAAVTAICLANLLPKRSRYYVLTPLHWGNGEAPTTYLGHECSNRLRLTSHGTNHVEADHISGAFPDGIQRRLAVQAGHAPVLGVSVTAVALHGLVPGGTGNTRRTCGAVAVSRWRGAHNQATVGTHTTDGVRLHTQYFATAVADRRNASSSDACPAAHAWSKEWAIRKACAARVGSPQLAQHRTGTTHGGRTVKVAASLSTARSANTPAIAGWSDSKLPNAERPRQWWIALRTWCVRQQCGEPPRLGSCVVPHHTRTACRISPALPRAQSRRV